MYELHTTHNDMNCNIYIYAIIKMELKIKIEHFLKTTQLFIYYPISEEMKQSCSKILPKIDIAVHIYENDLKDEYQVLARIIKEVFFLIPLWYETQRMKSTLFINSKCTVLLHNIV